MIHFENNIALIYFSNYFPFNDKEAFGFYKLYEKVVYAEIKKNNDCRTMLLIRAHLYPRGYSITIKSI